VREHGRKPDEMYDLIEMTWPGPYFELFARYPRDGWRQWPDPGIDAPETITGRDIRTIGGGVMTPLDAAVLGLGEIASESALTSPISADLSSSKTLKRCRSFTSKLDRQK
jgi:hypothetical protein